MCLVHIPWLSLQLRNNKHDVVPTSSPVRSALVIVAETPAPARIRWTTVSTLIQTITSTSTYIWISQCPMPNHTPVVSFRPTPPTARSLRLLDLLAPWLRPRTAETPAVKRERRYLAGPRAEREYLETIMLPDSMGL